jgi:hypothetical protein
MVDEYVVSRQISEVKDVVTELSEVHHVMKPVIAGNFVLYGYTKKPKEFAEIVKMLVGLVKEGVMLDKELEESYVFGNDRKQNRLLVVMGNFYDVLIDCPTAIEQLKELFTIWGEGEILSKEMREKCEKHAEELRKRLDEDYKKKGA